MQRLFTFVSQWVARLAAGASTMTLLLSGDGVSISPDYPVINSMSAMSRFPWVWTCVRAVAGDVAGLPLVAFRTERVGGRRRRVLVDDPLLRLLHVQPHVGMTGHLLRKQILVDYLLTGNAYLWRASDVELFRLHPSDVTPVPMGKGLGQVIGAFRVWDGERHVTLPASQILHIRDVSWAASLQSLLGESAIRCLHDDLTMEIGAKRLAANQALKGRPEILFSTEGQLGEEGAQKIVGRWEQATKALHGAFAVGRGVTATVLGWSPREFEFSARSEIVRDVILAVFEVPPARAGLAIANYGTQKQQMRTYYEAIARRVVAFDDAFSAWASPGVRIEHDLTDVEALQVSYTERQMRVVTWVSLGATPAAAAAYEGFDEAPVGELASAGAKPGLRPPSKPEEPQGDKGLHLAPALAAYFTEARPRYVELATAAAAGTDTSLLERWETERLFAVLDAIGGDHEQARWWAGDIVGSTVEALRVASADGEMPLDELDLEAFAPSRAARLAARMRAREAA